MHFCILGTGSRYISSIQLHSQVLRKILEEMIDHLIIVTLVRKTQPWYAQFLKMSVKPNACLSKKLVNKSTVKKSSSSRNRAT